jgi:hypothetical protein
MMLIEDFKKEINNSFKEIQANTGKQLEAVKEETQKSLKKITGKHNQTGEGIEQNHPLDLFVCELTYLVEAKLYEIVTSS